jgi:hypothetical protein
LIIKARELGDKEVTGAGFIEFMRKVKEKVVGGRQSSGLEKLGDLL